MSSLPAPDDRDSLARAVLAASADGVLVVDAHGVVLACNAAAQELLGRSRGELTGAHFGLPVGALEDSAGGEVQVVRPGAGGPGSDIRTVELRFAETTWEERKVTVLSLRDVTERMRAVEQVRGSQELLEQTVAGLEEAVIVTDAGPEGRSIRMANPAAERMFGYSSGELLGMSPRRLHGEPDRAAAVAGLGYDVLRREGRFQARDPLRRKDGTVFEAEQTIAVLDRRADGTPGRIVNVVRDVSERRRAEAELRASEARFRQIAEHIHDVFWISMAGRERIDYVSPAFRRVWGREPEEMYRDPGLWLQTMLPSDRARVRETVAAQAEGGWEEEYRIVRPDGQVRWIWDRAFPVEEDGRVDRIIGVAEDITDRKRAEERFGVLTQEITDLVFVVGPDGTVRFASPSAENFAGFPLEEFEGRDSLTWVHPDDRTAVKEALQAIVPVPGAVGRVQHRIITRDGEVRHVESAARNRLDHPAIEGIVVTSRDVTERVGLEEQLRQSQKMEAVGRLAGGIAHDFNNLLTVIRSQTDLILMDLPEGSPLVQDVKAVQASADRAARLTSQLLSFSREQVLRPRTVDLSGVVREMGELLERIIGEDVVIEYDLAEGLPPVRIDPGQLEQAVMNLAVNARDAMPSGGVLTLTTGFEATRDAETAALPGLPEGPCVVLRVADTGTGMDAATRSRIFEPFYTTKGTGKGTGLGLAMTYGFVKQSGGAIHVESAVGQGAEFTLRFPVAGGADGAARTPSPEGFDHEGATGRMLVVEDDPDVRRVTARILERAGFQVEAVGDAESGLEALEHEAYALLLTDLVLPGMSGRALLDAVRATRPGLRVVVMSGYAEGSPGRRSDLPEEIGFIQKPFTPEVLVETVRDALRRG